MKKNKVKIYNKYRDTIIPFFKGSSLIFGICGAVTAIFNPIVGVCEIGAGILVAGYCIFEDFRLRKQDKDTENKVKEMLIEEYKEEQKELAKQSEDTAEKIEETEREEVVETETQKTTKQEDLER